MDKQTKSFSDRGSNITFNANTNLAIHVTDLGTAEKFYGDILGFELIDRREGRLTYSTGAIHLYILKDDQIMPFIPALEVENYTAARAYLIGKGVKIIHEWPEEDKALYFQDPFGIVMDIVET